MVHITKEIADTETAGGAAAWATLGRRPRPSALPLSYAQQQLWFVHELEQGTNEFNIPHVWRLRGELNYGALAAAINCVVGRHEALRTHIGEVDGRPVQVIDPELHIDLPVRDVNWSTTASFHDATSAELQQEWMEQFDLTRGPLIRTKLLRASATEHLLVKTAHHLVTDGWSDALFIGELAATYNAYVDGRPCPLALPQLQYADFTLWQRHMLESGALDPARAYWRDRLKGLTEPLRLPTQRPRRRAWERGATRRVTLDVGVRGGLRALARAERTTVPVALLAAFQLLLARWSGVTDIPVGLVVANRTHRKLNSLIGFCVNFVVMRGELSGNPTFRELLRRTTQRCLEAIDHQQVPFEKLVEELKPQRNLGWNPLFQVVFNYLNFPRPSTLMHDVKVELLAVNRVARAMFDLKVDVAEGDEGVVVVNVSYNTHLFDDEAIATLCRDYERVLGQLIADPTQPVDV